MTKIAKGGKLEEFTYKTVENEFFRMNRNQVKTISYLDSVEALSKAFSAAAFRDGTICSKTEDKLRELEDEV